MLFRSQFTPKMRGSFERSVWSGKDENGKFLWPGYGENSRVLKWVFERCEGEGSGSDTAIGTVPTLADLDLAGLDADTAAIEAAVVVDPLEWKQEVAFIRDHFDSVGERLPAGMRTQLDELESRLG